MFSLKTIIILFKNRSSWNSTGNLNIYTDGIFLFSLGVSDTKSSALKAAEVQKIRMYVHMQTGINLLPWVYLTRTIEHWKLSLELWTLKAGSDLTSSVHLCLGARRWWLLHGNLIISRAIPDGTLQPEVFLTLTGKQKKSWQIPYREPTTWFW